MTYLCVNKALKKRYTDDSVCDWLRELAVLRVYRAETRQERGPPGGLPGTSQSVPVISVPTTKKRLSYTTLTLNLQWGQRWMKHYKNTGSFSILIIPSDDFMATLYVQNVMNEA